MRDFFRFPELGKNINQVEFPGIFVKSFELDASKTKRSSMKISNLVPMTVFAICVASCSGGSKATTREQKESEFKDAFGFFPPSAIVSIEYSDRYNRGLMDGAYGQWMSFTYDEEAYRRILGSGYNQINPSSLPISDASPVWWPKKIPGGSSVFSINQDDTTEDEGFSFKSYLWHDESTGQVFFQKSYWD